MLIKKFRVPIFGSLVYICVTDNLKKIHEHFKLDESVINIEDDAAAVTLVFSNTFIVGYTQTDIGTVCHEVLHLVHRILKHVGVEPSFTNDETEAYLFDFIIKKVDSIVNNR